MLRPYMTVSVAKLVWRKLYGRTLETKRWAMRVIASN
jgi:hypothetical protein